ncbi:hypothetical protein Y032_0014g2501 [Ancylostoma ceylanicum]|uniref:PLAT domain-containing protein n=1 Tax=Ancylostoma ceylanicum TaxID=53326 RepID=A0A016VBL1_9BILA|nr:hypothetical protein Y032_0014g2501 [Ancylostoma ceylanicum]
MIDIRRIRYVVTSSKYSRGINLSALERLKKAREQAHQSLRRENHGGQSFWIPTSPSYKQKLRMSRTLGFNVVPSRQVFFVLNGKGRFYRTLLNPLRLPSMEVLLHEISDGLQVAIFRLYSMEGVRILNVNDILNLSPPKVIACPRIERPYLGTTMLPSIETHRSGGKMNKSASETSYTTDGSQNENGIDKKPRSFASALKRNTRRTTGAHRKKPIKALPVIPQPPQKTPTVYKADDSDSGKANSISSRLTDTPKLDEEPEFAFNEELEKTLREAEKHLIAEDDESSEHSPKSTPNVDSGREHSNTSRSRDGEETLPSTSRTADDFHARRSVMSEAERKAEMIREEKLGNVTDEEDFIRDDDSDPIAGMYSDSDKEENLASDVEDVGKEVARARSSHSDREENLPSDNEEERQRSRSSRARTLQARPTGTADSEKEHILPSDDEAEEKPKSSRAITSESNREDILPSDDDEPPPLGNPKITRRLTSQSSREETLASDGEFLDEEGTAAEAPKWSVPRTTDSDREENLPSDDEELNERERAAIKIQAAFRGYRTRKSLKTVHFTEEPPNVIETEGPIALAEEAPDEKPAGAEEEAEQESVPAAATMSPRTATPGPGREKKMTYTISVTTGNRWGAETEAHLFIQMFGDEQTSRRFYLKQEADWLQTGETRFRQRHMDSFHVETEDLGTINQILIGHEQEGYGAGIFIDYVLITENVVEGRQFVCYCSKWFDSGQVDGKIERILPVAAFYYLNSIPDESMTSQGRWEFILHNGMEDGNGGTTSNLHIIGYGTTGSSMMHINNDKTMYTVPDTTLIQVDFGAIGDLLKVRFEVDGAGEKPDFYLEWVELRDLDTEERIAVRVGKWMDFTGRHSKKPQAFREISVFRSGDQPLEIQNYEGKVYGGDMRLLKDNTLQAQLIGDFSDSGVFPLIYNANKKEYSFKVECVHLGRINCIKVIGNFSEKGQAILEGFSVLQDIWDKHVGSVETAGNILAVSAHVRESTHCPYRYVLRESKIRELDDKSYFKVLTFSDMEGLATRNKKHKFTSDSDDWVLKMSIEGANNITPEVSLCSGHQSYPMNYQPDESNDTLYTYEMRGPSIGSLQKLRIGMGELEQTEHLYIKKMRLANQITKTILRFPSVDTEFESHQVYEFSPVYPDIQPTLNLLYTITLTTIASSGTFRPVFNLIGEEGESGMRKFFDDTNFEEGAPIQRNEFDVDAVNLGPLRELEVLIEGDEGSSWSVDVVVGMADNGVQYDTDTANIPTTGQLVRLSLQQR